MDIFFSCMINKYYKAKWFYLLPGLMYLAVMASCTGENNSDKFSVPHWRDNVDSLLLALHQKDSFNGTVLISVRDTLYKKAFGNAHLQPPLELSVDHVFYLGSLAKQFTATAIMVLKRDGLLEYDDPVIKYIPELPPVTKNITLRHMLNHTSGLPDYYTMGVFKPGMTNQMVLDAMLTLDSLSFEPAEKYAYSNSGYVLLSVVAERVGGKSLGTLLRERVFGPLRMSHTVVFDTTKPTLPPRATGYTPNGGPDDYGAFTTGGGGIFSNVEDLYQWAKRHDHPDVGALIDKEAYTPARLANDSLSYYGFGWRLDPYNNKIVQHSGSLVGFRTYLYQDLENDIVIILLSNFTNDVTGIQDKIHALLP
ncbi:MAG: beta-lactamase family protein [Cyclobacteriaceae bacterium]|nr:beta-lactamase family protein [Cyclobacteriaceae bacterium]